MEFGYARLRIAMAGVESLQEKEGREVCLET